MFADVSPEIAYRESIWWLLNQSHDPQRMTAVVTCYLDESAVNKGTQSPVAVVGGWLLTSEDYLWFSNAWDKTIVKHLPGRSFIHMKNFLQHGELANLTTEQRQAIFTDCVKVILRHKFISIAGILGHEKFEHHFSFLRQKENRTIHGMCFMLTAMAMTKWADAHGCKYDIPFMLDDGCADRKDIDATHDHMVNVFQKIEPSHFGPLAWGNDEKVPALQAADVISWAVRRRAANAQFVDGFEPLLDLFDEHHLEQEFESEWMEHVAIIMRSRMGRYEGISEAAD